MGLFDRTAPERRELFEIEHVGVPGHVAILNPTPRSGPPPTRGGLPLGRVLTDNSVFTLNPHELHTSNLTGGTSILVLGFRGSGKTNLLYLLAVLIAALENAISGRQRRVVVEDTRRNYDEHGELVPEYKNLVEGVLGGQHVDLLGSKINFLDYRLRLNPEQQFQLLLSLLEVVKGQELTPNERATLNVSIATMRTESPTFASVPVLQQVMARLSINDYNSYQDSKRHAVLGMIKDSQERESMRTRLNGDLNVAKVTVMNGAHTVSQLLDALMSGYDGIFGAENQIYDILKRAVVGLDLTRLNDDTIPLVEMVLWAIRRGDGANELGADLEIHDENPRRWESLVYATNMVTHLKVIRRTGSLIARSMQRVSDVDQITGAAQRAKAVTALSETDIVFIGRMERAQHKRLVETFRPIPQVLLDRLTSLRPGEFLVLIGESWPPFLVKIDLTNQVREAAYTDHARDLLQAGRRLN